MIEIKNVTKKYRKGKDIFTALDDISLKIENGDYCVVNGASGAGKSTLLYTIGGLIQPDAGEVLFNGSNIYDREGRFLDNFRKNSIGFMFQQFHLMPYLSVIDNIRLGCNEKKYLPEADHYIQECSLREVKNKYPSELSVGEKQRTAFIRAIISRPPILLADEPTGNLDPLNSSILISLIKEYHSKGGTVVLVSHDASAGSFSTHKLTLERGRIIGT